MAEQQQLPPPLIEPRAQPSWIYDDTYNCFKVTERILIVRLHDDHNLCWRFHQLIEKKDCYICMQCAASAIENEDEEYIYQSRAVIDSGLVVSEPHAQSCQPFPIKSNGQRTTRSSLAENIDWHYENSFSRSEIIDSNNNVYVLECIKVFDERNCFWKFVKSDSDEYKCETCSKYGWTTYAKPLDEKVIAQCHHPLCLPFETS
uniref:Uncharacterized protein n=1 Tax=Panagrolaimus sp. ES5 TaxID=591445 RepID=A0AC34FJG0_9BILA